MNQLDCNNVFDNECLFVIKMVAWTLKAFRNRKKDIRSSSFKYLRLDYVYLLIECIYRGDNCAVGSFNTYESHLHNVKDNLKWNIKLIDLVNMIIITTLFNLRIQLCCLIFAFSVEDSVLFLKLEKYSRFYFSTLKLN